MAVQSHPTSGFRDELNHLSERINDLERKPIDTGGGGSNNGGMEARVAKLEAIAEASDKRLTQIEGDLRELFRVAIGGFVLTWAGIIGLGLLILNK